MEHSAYLIAEIGGNHGGDPNKADDLIRAAAMAGADAIKMQAYRPEYLVTGDAPAYWGASGTQRQYFETTASFPLAVWKHLAAQASAYRIAFLLSAFDEELVDELDPLVAAWKVASGDITHQSLIRRIASKGKPVLLSTGASTIPEIYQALEWLGELPVCIMHCCLSYPAYANDANLRCILTLRKTFTREIGWSDHILGNPDVLRTAYALGANALEKHFTIHTDADGPDHTHSWTPLSLRADREAVDHLRDYLGTGEKIVQQCESAARRYARRSMHRIDGQPRMLRPNY